MCISAPSCPAQKFVCNQPSAAYYLPDMLAAWRWILFRVSSLNIPREYSRSHRHTKTQNYQKASCFSKFLRENDFYDALNLLPPPWHPLPQILSCGVLGPVRATAHT